MSIESLVQTINFLDEVGTGNDDLIQAILLESEKTVSTWCRRTFESTSYSLERYSGRGYRVINLNNYPVTALDRVAVGVRNVMTIKNTNSGTSASVSVTSTGLRLVLDGTPDVTVTWASNATIATVITAVNALGNGWVAAICSTAYNSFKSTDLISQNASSCIDNRVIYLSIPDTAEPDVDVDMENGQIRLVSGFYPGYRNIFVDYTAGYTNDTMPSDLKLAVKILVQYMYQQVKEGNFGVDLHNIGASGSTGARVVFEKGFIIPKECERILSWYKRRLV